MSVPPTSQLTLLPTEFVYEGAEYIFGERPFFPPSFSLVVLIHVYERVASVSVRRRRHSLYAPAARLVYLITFFFFFKYVSFQTKTKIKNKNKNKKQNILPPHRS